MRYLIVVLLVGVSLALTTPARAEVVVFTGAVAQTSQCLVRERSPWPPALQSCDGSRPQVWQAVNPYTPPRGAPVQWFRLRESGGFCLGYRPDAHVHQFRFFSCASTSWPGDPNQRNADLDWRRQPLGDGRYQLIHRTSGLALSTFPDSGYAGVAPSAPADPAQHWAVVA